MNQGLMIITLLILTVAVHYCASFLPVDIKSLPCPVMVVLFSSPSRTTSPLSNRHIIGLIVSQLYHVYAEPSGLTWESNGLFKLMFGCWSLNLVMT